MVEINVVYCVNIRKRPDRLQQFKKNAKKAGMHRLTNEIKMTTDWENNLNGEDITDEWLLKNNMGKFENWCLDKEGLEKNASEKDADGDIVSGVYSGINGGYAWWDTELSGGELGCTISHTEIWKRAKGYTLILEDDIVFMKNWLSKMNNALNTIQIIDSEWDLLYVGRIPQLLSHEKRVAHNITKPLYSFCTYGYILSPSGIKKLLKYEVEKEIIPADEILSASYIAHPRIDVRLKYPPTLSAYAMRTPIVKEMNKNDSDTGER